MGIASVQFKSAALGKRVTYQVIIPEPREGEPVTPFPALLQLHGLSDDSGAWITRANLARYAEEHPFLVVLPDGGTSGYVNWRESGRLHRQHYEDFIMQDLLPHVRRTFNVAPGPWAIGGLSMGGYGAMRLGLKFPDQFRSIWAHSAAFHIHEHLDPALVESVADSDVYHHATQVAARANPPVISFDCGVDDELLVHNRRLHDHLTQLGLTHHYAEHPGDHNWEYWDEHVHEALAQHQRVMLGG